MTPDASRWRAIYARFSRILCQAWATLALFNRIGCEALDRTRTPARNGRLTTVRIATFNINNVNRRLPNLLGWLAVSAPDVVCLQELKCAQADFPADAIHKAGYHAVWKGERSWNGVAILARKREPVSS